MNGLGYVFLFSFSWSNCCGSRGNGPNFTIFFMNSVIHESYFGFRFSVHSSGGDLGERIIFSLKILEAKKIDSQLEVWNAGFQIPVKISLFSLVKISDIKTCALPQIGIQRRKNTSFCNFSV